MSAARETRGQHGVGEAPKSVTASAVEPGQDGPSSQPAGEENTEEQPEDDAPGPFVEWSRLTGNWFGLRDLAEQQGITFDAYYSVDFFTNARGGLSTNDAPEVFALFDLSLSLDTEALGLWKGGTIYLDMQDFRGRTPSEGLTGDLLLVNGNDAPERLQLSEYWWEQAFFDGRVRTKIGKQDANADFATNEYGAEFLNAAPYYISNMPIPTYPDPAIGAALFVEPADWISFGAGIYDAEGIGDQTGFNTAFHGEDASMTIAELALKPVFKLARQELPGVYRVGGWYHSGLWDVYFNDLQGRLRPRLHRGNAGVYCSFDQRLFKEKSEEPGDVQGLGTFFQFGWAPSLYNEITAVYGAGLQYTGLIPGRDDDVTGLGFYHASLGGPVQSLEGRYAESVIEYYYKIQLTGFMSIKPDVQYVFDPGGDGRDALVVGARLEVSF